MERRIRDVSRDAAKLLRGPVLVAAVLLAGIGPALGDPGYRINLAYLKSTHPDSDRKRDYSTNHPSAGVGGPVTGEWLRWRAGMARNSHARWGPYAGLSATFEIAEDWRAGLNAGLAGNYNRGWFRAGSAADRAVEGPGQRAHLGIRSRLAPGCDVRRGGRPHSVFDPGDAVSR